MYSSQNFVSGPLLAIDAYTFTLTSERVKLSEMHKDININNRIYKLLGFVNFKPPIPQTRGSGSNQETLKPGHYTTGLCQKNKFTEIDDLLVCEKPISQKALVIPHLIIYSN